MTASTSVSFSMRLVCRFVLIALILTIVYHDVASAASKKFIKGFILGALLAKNHYPVVMHESSHKHKF